MNRTEVIVLALVYYDKKMEREETELSARSSHRRKKFLGYLDQYIKEKGIKETDLYNKIWNYIESSNDA